MLVTIILILGGLILVVMVIIIVAQLEGLKGRLDQILRELQKLNREGEK